MEIKIFSDAIDALEKVAKAVIALQSIPKQERQRYKAAVKDSYALMNSAVNLVFLRLGDILLLDKKGEFLKEVRRLDNAQEWLQLERDVRLCNKLRDVHGEIDNFVLSRMIIRLGSRDWDKVRQLVDELLEREGTLADYLSASLRKLARQASVATRSSQEYANLRRSVTQTRRVVERERQRLIASELEFIKVAQ